MHTWFLIVLNLPQTDHAFLVSSSSGLIIVVSALPKIPHILKDNLSLPFPLLLVFLDPLILVNKVHKLTYTPSRLPGQRLPQIMPDRQADLESPNRYFIEIPINLIKHLPVPVGVCFQGLPLLHGHGLQKVQRPMNSIASNKMRSKRPSKILKGINRTSSQAIKPSYCHRLQTGWEHLAHQGFILGVNNHPLVEVAHMFYKVCLTIVHGEYWLSKLPRKFSSFNSAYKGDLEIWFNALLIASFPKPLQDELLFLHSWWLFLSHKKDSLGGVLDLGL